MRYNRRMNMKLMAVAAVAACMCAGFGGTKSVGYIGASTGTKPGSLKIVEVDNDTGAIDIVGTLPLANTTYIAVNKARTLLYTSCADAAFGGKGANGGVAVYSIDPSGKKLARLDAVGTTRGAPCHLSLSPDETKLVFAEYSKGTAGWIDLKKDGTFVKDSRQVIVSADPVGPDKSRQEHPHCHCARVTPDGKYVCIVDLGTDRVKIYSAKDGSFVRDLVTTPAGGGPRHITFHPNGKFAFVLFELQNLVTSYRYADGVFTPIQQLSLIPEGFTDFSKAAAVKLSADGRQLFCTNRGHNSIAVFDVEAASGRMTRRGIMSLGGDFPWDFEFMPGGNILAVGLMKDKLVRTYRYDAEKCTLTPIADAKDMGSIFCTTFFPAN